MKSHDGLCLYKDAGGGAAAVCRLGNSSSKSEAFLETALGTDSTQNREIEKMRHQLRRIQDIVESVHEKQLARELGAAHDSHLEHEWRLMATIMDRVLFLVYLVAIIIALLILFPRPHGA